MQIRRDYDTPLFSDRRRRGGRWRGFFVLLLLIAGAGLALSTQRERIQAIALQAVGVQPTATPLPGELAMAAMDYAVVGNLDAAAVTFEQALAMRPDDIDYMYEYGLILIDLERYDDAQALGDSMIQRSTFDPRGYALKGRALVWAGDAAAALPVALVGLETDREFAPLHAVLARAYVANASYQAALEHGALGVQYNPLDADARRAYAYVLNTVGEYDAAIEQLEIAVAANPNAIDTQMELAGYYLWRDRDDEAIDIYNGILAAQPRNARAMLRLCDAQRKQGNFNVALGHCEDAASLDPEYVDAQFRLAMIYYSDRRFSDALPYFQRCVDLEPDNLSCSYRLGLTHYYLFSLDADPAEGAAHCDSAWTLLQDSLLMAQSRAAAEVTMENIRLGLGLVSRECPAYRGAAAQYEPTAAPPTPDPALSATQEGG